MIKLCVFDLDGTIANTLNSIAYFANRALEKYGFKPYDMEEYKEFIGAGADNLIREMIKGVNGTEKDFKNVKAEYMETYKNDCCYLTEPFCGILELLVKLKKMGIMCGVLSNKPQEQVDVIYNKFFKDYMNFGQGGKVGTPLKPDPQSLFDILEKYNVKKEECLFIGDSEPDMLLAQNADVKSVGCLWGYRDEKILKENGARYIVTTPDEIIDIILKI